MKTNARNIGVLGGSFDPIHFGHIKPCIELANDFQLEKIILLPCKVSPFKDGTFASAQHRWNMIQLIATNSDLFVADARELERESPSYTYTSLKDLSEELNDNCKLFWIMGIDSLAEFPDWYEAEQIMQYCHVLVTKRPGYTVPQEEEILEWLSQFICEESSQLEQAQVGKIFITNTEMLNISSTDIRHMINLGEQPKFMLPGSVWNYIKRNKLYIDN